MKIRNLPYKDLNDKEKAIVKAHYNSQTKPYIFEGKKYPAECEGHPQCKTLNGFWEAHREGDTDDGRYSGWVLPKKK
jgi:hypothetical protein